MPGLNLTIIGLFERLLWGITLLRRKHVSAEATTATAADTESCCASIRQQSPAEYQFVAAAANGGCW